MVHIKDLVLSCKMGGGTADWEYLESYLNDNNIDIVEDDILECEHFHDILRYAYYKKIEQWARYIKEHGEDHEKVDAYFDNWDMFFNYLDSRIDIAGELHEDDSNEEALKIYRENK